MYGPSRCSIENSFLNFTNRIVLKVSLLVQYDES